VRVGIVVPYSWSFWGAVVEHTESQAAALRELGVDTLRIMGNDPPGQFSRVLHPRVARLGDPPPDVRPVGRSVIVPANGSLPNLILSPRSVWRMYQVLRNERFDVLHLHEPMAPVPGVAALALAEVPVVATFHAAGELNWMRWAKPIWGFLAEGISHRIAVSPAAAESAAQWLPGEYELLPNGTVLPDTFDPGGREHQILFAGRHEPRKGLKFLLRAWPKIERETGLRLRVAGADPLAVRWLLSQVGTPTDGIDILGFLSQEELTRELLQAKAFVAPALGQESFGMALTRAFGCATPVVASDIPGYRTVMEPDVGVTFLPADEDALVAAVAELLSDEERRARFGERARAVAEEKYAWPKLAARLAEIYERIAGAR
jgi:phosphatidylinositol alpha-mannosyltransferase